MDKVKVIEVIYCSKRREGDGTPLDPIRVVEEIFDFKGNLISENDPAKVYTKKDMIEFGVWSGITKENSINNFNGFEKRNSLPYNTTETTKK